MSNAPVSPGGGSHQNLFIDMASDKCQREKRKTINGDDLLRAIATLGSEVYIKPVKVYLARYKEMEDDTKGSAKGGDSSARKDAMGGQFVPNAQGSFNPSVNYGSSQGLIITAANALNQDQRKRALEALERRFSAAESEILCNERRHKKSRGEGDINVMTTSHLNSPSTTAPNKIGASSTPYRDASLKKNVKADDIYMKILQPVHENLLTIVEASDGGKEIVRKVQHHLLSGGDVAQKYLQGFGRKYGHGYIRLDCCVQGQSRMDDRSRALRSLSKRSKKHMSMKELKMYGSHNLPLELMKYDIFIPMHEMWKDYVMQMLKNVGKHKVADCLLAADLHGAILRVIGCKTDAFTGVVGIMIRETAEAFGIVTQENKFKVVPKRSSVFVLQASCWKITVHGESRITGRPAEGAMKK